MLLPGKYATTRSQNYDVRSNLRSYTTKESETYCVVFRVDKAMKSCSKKKDTNDLSYGKFTYYIRVIPSSIIWTFSLLCLQAIQSVYNVTTKLKEVTSEVVVKVTERKANAPVSRTFWHLVAMANGLGWKSPRIANHAKMVRISFLSKPFLFLLMPHKL